MSFAISVIALAQLATGDAVSKTPASDFGQCVFDAATQFAKSSESADLVVDAALAKCRAVLERYVADAPPNSLAALPSAQESTRRTLTQLAREKALVRVLEIRSQ